MAEFELPRLVVETVSLFTSSERLVLVNRDPAPDESDVPLEATIGLELVDTGAAGIDRASVRILVNHALAFEGGTGAEFAPAFAGSLAAVVATSDTLRVVLHPIALLPSLATLEVRVVASTIGGAGALDATYRFTVEDRTAPRVVSAQAVAPRVVRIAFDEAVSVPAGAG